jgi:spore germination cell wall hydrolase CwlJ-like protein
MKATDAELDILAKTLFGEARGEGFGGMVAVAHVVLNRVKLNGWMGKSIIGVCQKPWQFSCWNGNDLNSVYLRGGKPIPSGEYMRAREAAVAAVEGHEPDPTAGATHYYAKSMKTPPAWVKGAKPTVTIGNHRFFKDVP